MSKEAMDKLMNLGLEEAQAKADEIRKEHRAKEADFPAEHPQEWEAFQQMVSEIQEMAAKLSLPDTERTEALTELLTNIIADAAMALADLVEGGRLPSQVLASLANGTRRVEMQVGLAALLSGEIRP